VTSVKNKTIFKGDNNDNGRWRDTESDVIGCRAVTWARPPPCWRRVTTSTAGGGEKMSNDIPMSKSGGLKNDCCWWCWWLCWSMSVAPEPEWWSTMSSEPLPLCSVSSSSADYITSQTAVIHKFIFYCWCSFYCFYLTDFDRFICFNLLYLFSPSAYLFFNRVELSRSKRYKGKGRYSSSWEPHVRALQDVTCYMGSHSVTCHPTQVNVPRQTPAMQAGTRFTYPGGMEGWVDLVDLIAPWPGVELLTFRSRRPLDKADRLEP